MSSKVKDNIPLQVMIPQAWEHALDKEVREQGYSSRSEYLRMLIVSDSQNVRNVINASRRKLN